MPVQEYGTMQFGKYDEIRDKGYQAASDRLRKWEDEGKLSAVLESLAEVRNQGKKKGKSARRNSI